MREAELAERDRARGKISMVGAFWGAFLLIILGKARLGGSYWVLFEPQTTHHFQIRPQELQDSCEQPVRLRAHSGRFAAY